LAVIAGLQWRVLDKTDRTLRDTLEANIVVQRASVSATKLQIEPFKDAKGIITHWVFTPYIQNSGPTVATRVRVNGNMSGFMEGMTDNYPTVDLPDAPYDPEMLWKAFPAIKGRGFIAPRADPSAVPPVGSAVPVGGAPVQFLSKSNKRRYHWYVDGIIGYHDAFNGTMEHKAKFCYVISVKDGWDGQIPPDQRPCEYWNCLDESCDQDREYYMDALRSAFDQAKIPFPASEFDPFGVGMPAENNFRRTP
jgi:hypothetical protein